jgi:phospholipid/cholesterol/gamma-HCH transport system ATP-binding protein
LLILEIQKKYNTASVIITHDVKCASITANRMIVVNGGAPVAEGTFEELAGSEDEWIRSFYQ